MLIKKQKSLLLAALVLTAVSTNSFALEIGGAHSDVNGNGGSVAIGSNNKLTGIVNNAVGESNTVTGNYNDVLGSGVVVNAENSVTLGNGSTNTRNYTVSVGTEGQERQITNVKAGEQDTDAVNVSQLKTVEAKISNIQDYVTPDGLNANHKTIINVADGVNPTDAVNKGQLDNRINSDGQTITIFPKDTATTVDFRGTDADGNRIDRVVSGIKVDENDRSSATNVGYVNDAVSGLNNKLSRQIADVGANSAALAALHPVDYDPDYKFNIAAGYGNYKGENAYALGAFYRPNENIMFSVGGTLGSDDNAINAGVSFKFGHSSKVVRQSDIKGFMKDVSERLARLEAENAQLKSENKSLRNVRASFPDVPKDHWANSAVEILHGNGVLQGYEDGEFKGNRPMTRYEYAQMLFNNEVSK